MKQFKVLLLAFSVFMILSYSSFAQDTKTNPSRGKSGFVFSIIGGSSVPYDYIDKDIFAINAFSYLQPGYLLSFGNGIGIGLLFNIGYNMSMVSSLDIGDHKNFDNGERREFTGVNVHSSDLGLTLAVNIKDFMLGFSGGVKIPIYASTYMSAIGGDSDNFDFATIGKNVKDSIGMTQYAKISADYLFFVDTRTAITLGVNVAYDFEMEDDKMFYASTKGFSFGGQIGIRFGPRL